VEVSGVIEEIFADLGLTGKVVIVTGAGTGIGAATAIRLARSGAHVSLIGRTSETLTNVQHIIEEFGGKALCVTADMSDEGSGRTIVDATLERFGQLDGIVNNAATIRHFPIEEWPVDVFDDHIATNIRGPFLLIRDSVPHLRSSTVRSIVNVSSSSGSVRRVGQSVYGMTKAALDYLTQSLAGELASDGIRVNAIVPGPVDTPIHKTWATDLDEAYKWLATQSPLGRIAEPDEIARWITFLLSPVTSFVTGAVIPVDGGQVIDRE
jgi:NAD(P)-dependent dehydrogenase (short-subunit alcohol dehydrogenase family)